MSKMISCKDNFGNIVSLPKEKFFFRPSVYGLIVDNGKIVTLTNKSNGKYWFPGGGIEVGEKIEEALLREVREETGLNIVLGKFLFFKENFFYYQPSDEAYHAYLFFYLCSTAQTDLITDDEVDDYESQSPRWTEIASIKKEQIGDVEDDIFAVLKQIQHTAY